MIKNDLINLEGKIVTEKEFEKIYESDLIINFQNCGRSGLKNNCIWIILMLLDGTEINLYIKEN